jgi:flagellar basal-body rod modification protein FlgD
MDISALTGETTHAANISRTSTLDKDAFLGLIVSQMQNQNPLEPTSATEFMAQLTQLGTLEQVQNVNANLEKFLGGDSPDAMARAARLIGRRIEYLDSATGEVLPGLVSAVSRQDGEVVLDIGASAPVRFSDVVRVVDGAVEGEV